MERVLQAREGSIGARGRVRALRRRAAGRALNHGFHALSLLGRLHPHARPARQGVERIKDIGYRPDSQRRAHLLDVYRPSAQGATDGLGEGPWPVVFYVHGGGFRALSKDTHWLMGLGFARRGYLVVNVSYRLAPRHPYPAPLIDVCDALEFALANVERWGGDPGRISLAGESAGANLVSALAIAASYERPEPWARKVFDALGRSPGGGLRAVLAHCGILEVTDAARFRRRKPDMPSYVAWIIEDVERSYLPWGAHALANPLTLLEQGLPPDRSLPPFHLAVGTADPLLDDTRRMAAALERLGVAHEAAYYPGQPHAFHVAVPLPEAKRCWRDMHAFLAAHNRA